MSVVKPVSIRAAQWGTIAEDVKTGRVKALFGGRQVKDRYAHVFDVDNDIPIQSVNHESVLILEWQDDIPERPAFIRADQWETIAEDVKAGRVKAWISDDGDELEIYSRCHDGSFSYDNGLEGGTIELSPDDILSLEWQDTTPPAEKPLQIVLTENMNQMHQAGVDMREEIARLQAENERLSTELDALSKRYSDERPGDYLNDSIVQVVEEAIDQWPEITTTSGNEALAEMRRLYEQKCAELDAANQRVDAYLNHLEKLREAQKPFVELYSRWLDFHNERPSVIFKDYFRYSEAYQPIIDTCEHLATMALRELDKSDVPR